jgi:hypothetical protein
MTTLTPLNLFKLSEGQRAFNKGWAMPSRARATGLRPQPATRSSQSSVPIAEQADA